MGWKGRFEMCSLYSQISKTNFPPKAVLFMWTHGRKIELRDALKSYSLLSKNTKILGLDGSHLGMRYLPVNSETSTLAVREIVNIYLMTGSIFGL
jgi:hypothetical protein